MKFLRNPIEQIVYDLCTEAKQSICLCAPFVKEDIVKNILNSKNENVQISLVTNLSNAYTYTLDIPALRNIINHGGKVYNRSNLHAKFYLFDANKAIITSGNLTKNGLYNNYEYGLYIDNELVFDVDKDYHELTENDDLTGIVSLKNLDDIEIIKKNIKPVYTLKHKSPEFDKPIHSTITTENIIPLFKENTWKELIFKVIDQFDENVFTKETFNEYKGKIHKAYPLNKYPDDKIRQILQQLRDLGLVAFLGNGFYERLWIPTEFY